MAVSGIAQVDSDKLSGIIFNANLNFQQQDELTVKVCSQWRYLLKLLKTRVYHINIWTVF